MNIAADRIIQDRLYRMIQTRFRDYDDWDYETHETDDHYIVEYFAYGRFIFREFFDKLGYSNDEQFIISLLGDLKAYSYIDKIITRDDVARNIYAGIRYLEENPGSTLALTYGVPAADDGDRIWDVRLTYHQGELLFTNRQRRAHVDFANVGNYAAKDLHPPFSPSWSVVAGSGLERYMCDPQFVQVQGIVDDPENPYEPDMNIQRHDHYPFYPARLH